MADRTVSNDFLNGVAPDCRVRHYRLTDLLVLTDIERAEGPTHTLRFDFVMNCDWETLKEIATPHVPATAIVESALMDIRDEFHDAVELALQFATAYDVTGADAEEVLQ
jgi:hypothetical protein